MIHRPALRSAVLAGALVAATMATAAPAVAGSGTVFVAPDESIQAALDDAGPGTRIVVLPGTHHEQLTITQDDITLVGQRAVLVPPATPVTNPCTGLADGVTQVGICIVGSDVVLAPFEREHRRLVSVGRRVRDVVVKGFEVRGFSGANIALVGADHGRIADNQLEDGSVYGALSVGAIATTFSGNVVTAGPALGGIGMCLDDITPSTMVRNDVSGYVVGLCVQTQQAAIVDNHAHDNCIGVYVDPGFGARVANNRIESNNADCLAFEFINGIGIYLDGTVGADVRNNRLEGHRPGGFGAAIVLADAADGPDATGNLIRGNTFRSNTLDLLVTASLDANTIRNNRCSTSDPLGLCR